MRFASNYLLQKSLKKRLNLLGDVENLASNMVKTRDWTLQLLSLDLIEKENRRIHSQLTSMSAPRHLKQKQRKQYTQLVAKQAAPFLIKANKTKKKLMAFWGNNGAINGLAKDYGNSTPTISTVVAEEIQALRQVAPSSHRAKLGRFLSSKKKRPSRSAILNARRALVKDPFDTAKIEKLIQLERSADGKIMVAYLDARLTQLKRRTK